MDQTVSPLLLELLTMTECTKRKTWDLFICVPPCWFKRTCTLLSESQPHPTGSPCSCGIRGSILIWHGPTVHIHTENVQSEPDMRQSMSKSYCKPNTRAQIYWLTFSEPVGLSSFHSSEVSPYHSLFQFSITAWRLRDSLPSKLCDTDSSYQQWDDHIKNIFHPKRLNIYQKITRGGLFPKVT